MIDLPQSDGLSAETAPAQKSSMPAWTGSFLAALAATSKVATAAQAAAIEPAVAYALRRENAAFGREWRQALHEGYENLEMELLHRLRTGEVKPPAGAKRGTRTFDNATALRLLAAHRESAARLNAMRDAGDTETILASINAKLERMRERRLQAEQSGGDDGE